MHNKMHMGRSQGERFGGYFTWSQIQRERKKWLIDLKAAYEMERYKTRLASYPKVFEIIANHYSIGHPPYSSIVASICSISDKLHGDLVRDIYDKRW
jgi:hypothetical protein